jgi:hypothetical protein
LGWGIKIKQKVAMRFRTLQGAKVLARLQAAMKMNAIGKKGMNALQTLLDSNYNKQAPLKYT